MGCYDMRGNLWGKPESEISAPTWGQTLSLLWTESHRPTIGDNQDKPRPKAQRQESPDPESTRLPSFSFDGIAGVSRVSPNGTPCPYHLAPSGKFSNINLEEDLQSFKAIALQAHHGSTFFFLFIVFIRCRLST